MNDTMNGALGMQVKEVRRDSLLSNAIEGVRANRHQVQEINNMQRDLNGRLYKLLAGTIGDFKASDSSGRTADGSKKMEPTTHGERMRLELDLLSNEIEESHTLIREYDTLIDQLSTII